MNKNVKKNFKKYFWLKTIFQVLYYIALYLPILIFVICNREKYFMQYEGIKVSIGLIIGAVVVVIATRKDNKIIKGIWWYVIFFVLCYFLGSIINDLIYFALYLLIGKFISLFIEPTLNYYKKVCETYIQSGHQANIFKETFKEESEK